MTLESDAAICACAFRVVDYDGQSTANEHKSVSGRRSENIINKCNTLLTKSRSKGLSAFKSSQTHACAHNLAPVGALGGDSSFAECSTTFMVANASNCFCLNVCLLMNSTIYSTKYVRASTYTRVCACVYVQLCTAKVGGRLLASPLKRSRRRLPANTLSHCLRLGLLDYWSFVVGFQNGSGSGMQMFAV